MMIPLWYGLLLGGATAYFGFWVGRSKSWGPLEVTARRGETEDISARGARAGRGGGNDAGKGSRKDLMPRRIFPGVRYLASPTSGMVEQIEEAGRRGARIVTSDSKLYSPSAGRVLSIAPRGNSFLIMTDWGSEVEVRACTSEDDLLDRYFRPRVIRGEIIRRGKLLLEYDREKLSRECEDTAVYLMAEKAGDMEPAGDVQVEMGEALFWVN